MPKYKLDIDIKSDSQLVDDIRSLERMVQLKKELKGELKLTDDKDIAALIQLVNKQKNLLEQTNKLKKTIQEKQKVDKDQQRLRKQLIDSTDKEVKGRIRLRLAMREQTKELTRQIKAESGETDRANKLKQSLKEKQKAEIDQANKLKQIIKEKQKVEKEEIRLGKKLKAQTDVEVKGRIRLRLAVISQTKALTQQVKRERSEIDAITKLQAVTKRAERNFKNLAITQGTSSKAAQIAQKRFAALDTRLRKVNAAARNGTVTARRFGSAWVRVSEVMRGVAGFLGITAGFIALQRVASNIIGIFTQFEKANSKLEAVLGATTEQMKALSDQAKALGAITAFTATEVTGLQIELSKLGFPTEDILLMTQSILDASAAMDSDLAETAKLTGAILKSFGLDASETSRVTDVLAKSTAISALDFEKLSSSMSTIAPVADKFGFSLEGTISLLGQLSDAGFDASSAATATRKILLNLADANGDLSKSLKEPVKDLPSLVRGLKQLQKEGVDLGKALELTDVKSVAAFATFLDGADAILEMNDALELAQGTAEEMARIQLDNLAGVTTILNSAWEGFTLSLEDGNGAFATTLKFIVLVATEVLSLLTGTEKLTSELSDSEKEVRKFAKSLLNVGRILGTLIKAFFVYKAVIIATNLAMKIGTAVTNAFRVAQAALTGGVKGATTAFKAFNMATKANIIGVIIALLLAAVSAFNGFSKAAKEAAKRQRELNQRIRESQRLQQISAAGQRIAEKLQIRINARIKAGESIEKLRDELSRQLASDESKRNKIRLDELKDQQVEEERIRTVAFEKEKRGRSAKGTRLIAINEKFQSDLLEIGKRFDKKRENLDNIIFSKEAAELGIRIEAFRLIIDNLTKRIPDADAPGADPDKDAKRDTRLRDLRTANIENQFKRELTLLQNKLDDEIAKEGTTNEIRIELEIKFNNDVEKLRERFDAKLRDKRQKNLDEEVELKRVQLVELQILALEGEKNFDEIAAKEIEIERAKLDAILFNEGVSFEKKKLAVEEFNKFVVEKEKEKNDKLKKSDQERLDEIKTTLSKVTDATIEALERRSQRGLELIDKEISDQQANVDIQRQRAANNQKSTLEQETQTLKELEIKRAEAEKKEQRRLKILAYFALLQGYAKTDSKTALRKTGRDIAIAEVITAAFGEKGGVVGDVKQTTQISGSTLSKSHGKGSDVLIVADKEEGLLSKPRMRKLGGKDGLDRLGTMIDAGMSNDILFPKVPAHPRVIKQEVDNRLVKEIQALQEIIRNKKETSTKVDKYGNVIYREVQNGVAHVLNVMRKRPRF